MTQAPERPYPSTPDGRYFVVRGRLWRRADPNLPEARRAALVSELMEARRAVRSAKAKLREGGDDGSLAAARKAVHAAKVALGERGSPWWDDGAADLNRHLARNTPYAAWYAALTESTSTENASLSGSTGVEPE